MKVVVVEVMVVVLVVMSDDRLGYWQCSIINCLRFFSHIKSRLVGCNPVAAVVVVVLVVAVVVVKVVLMFND